MAKKKNIKKTDKAPKKVEAPKIKPADKTLLKSPEICLVMIVKNESKVIRRCIDSVRNYIHHWVIVDTGSTDGTQTLIKDIMEEYKIPGELHERPWVDFGTNRSESLALSKGKGDYRLVIDADDVLDVTVDENPFTNLDKDVYKVKIKLNALVYFRTQMVRSNQDWKYVGVLHEYITGPTDIEIREEFLDGVAMLASVSGHTREIKGQEKYYNDALIFEKALAITPKEDFPEGLESRYMFYMAQSYRDAGQLERAIESYEKRATMGGWAEEIYISKYWVARLKSVLERPDAEIIDSYLKAWESRPIRLEALYHLIKFVGSRKRYAFAFALASIAMKSQPCNDLLFVEEEIWKWRMPDEYSVLAFYNGNAQEAIDYTQKIIDSPVFLAIPPADRERIKKNLGYYKADNKTPKKD